MKSQRKLSATLASILILTFGCSSSHATETIPPPPPEPGTEASALVGPAGGVVELGALRLTVPPGALSDERTLRVVVTSEVAPAGFTAFAPVVRFEPAGTTFAVPARIELPFSGDASIASVFWSRAAGDGYVALATRVESGVAVADVTHFSTAFVGTACTGADCCRRATGQLDVLLVVDNSNSMTEEQASLATELPRMAQVLATGDLDGDGTQDFPAVSDLQMGVVTSDMGSGGFAVPTCSDPGLGDDGILRTAGNSARAGCASTYPAIATYSDSTTGDPAMFASDVACVAAMGTGGCGLEQQLEASLKAVTPSTSPLRFMMGTAGHGDVENAGMVRPDSVLAVVQITDEDDCSAANPELFNPDSSVYPGELNLRCFQYPSAAHPVTRFVDGLLAMRSDPSALVFAAITGVPSDLTTDPALVSFDTILADPRMQEVIDPAMPTRLTPACEVPGRGMAFPARRLVQTARDLDARGASGIVQSICQEGFTPAVTAILREVAARLAGSCS